MSRKRSLEIEEELTITHNTYEEIKLEVKNLLSSEFPPDPLLIIRSLHDQRGWSLKAAALLVSSFMSVSRYTLLRHLRKGETTYKKHRKYRRIKDSSTNWDLLPSVIQSCIGQGAREFMHKIGSTTKNHVSQRNRRKFLEEASYHIEQGHLPWFSGTPESLWELLHKRTGVRGVVNGKRAAVKDMFVVTKKKHKTNLRQYILKNGLHRDKNYPSLKYICNLCGVEGSDPGYIESPWNHVNGNQLKIYGGIDNAASVYAEIKLVLDHINGNRRDERLENLRFICYNCDPFTPHFIRKKWEEPRSMKHILKEQELWNCERIKSGVFGCQLCNRETWNTVVAGLPFSGLIPLETDHIDGNRKNNDNLNLRRICRQCHANTPTFGGCSQALKSLQMKAKMTKKD